MTTSNKTTNRKLNGIYSGLSYLGVNPTTPPNSVVYDRVPTTADYQGYLVGDVWILPNTGIIPSQTAAQIWVLTALAAKLATWTQIFPATASSLDFITDNGTVMPALGVVNVNGAASGNISTAANPTGSNNMTIAVSGTTNHTVQLGNATGSLTSLANGTTGQLLTAVTGANPVWSSTLPAGALTFTGDTGTAQPAAGNINFKAAVANNSGSSVSFSATGSTVTFNDTDANSNVIFGLGAGNSTISGTDNNAVGVGNFLLLTSGSANVAVGSTSLNSITSGSYNTAAGAGTGTNYTGTESSNILVGALVAGTLGESHVLRIGNGTGAGNGQLQKAFISGIDGVNVGSVATVVTEASNQLGTAVLTAGAGITITPGANLITIASTGGATSKSIMGAALQQPAAGIKTWSVPFSSAASQSTQAFSSFTMPCAGTVSNLYVNVYINNSTSTDTVTVNKNSVNTALVATITGSTIGIYTDLTHSVVFAAGDKLQFEFSAATTGVWVADISLQFVSS